MRWAVAVAVVAAITAGCSMELSDIAGQRIPSIALDAYQRAAEGAASVAPGCVVDWPVVAGLARVESNHGRVDGPRTIGADGDVMPAIRGLPLDGTNGRQKIADTDGGALDGDSTWDRAMGPFQFIPTTWRELGRDGNGDGVADPDNLYDAALTAVAHLCLREAGDYGNRAELRRALVAYNASGAYAEDVLEWIARYRDAPIEELIVTTNSPAPS